MNWIVNIENNKDLRITVNLNPINQTLFFNGEFKMKNSGWEVFITEEYSPLMTKVQVESALYKIHKTLKARVDIYNNVKEVFSTIKVIEILD
jgi:hypothetical protein